MAKKLHPYSYSMLSLFALSAIVQHCSRHGEYPDKYFSSLSAKKYGPRQAKMCRACVEGTDSDSYHADTKSNPDISFQFIHSIVLMILFVDSKGPDQTARMCSLIWASAVHICPKTLFYMVPPIYCVYFEHKENVIPMSNTGEGFVEK